MDDGSTDATLDILRALQRELPILKIVERKPPECGRGKSAVLNHGLRASRGEIIAVFDADTRVEPNFLIKSVACLYDPTVGGVQGRVRIYNAHQNLLTIVQEDEFSVLAHLVQASKDVLNGMTGLGGNGQLTRRAAIEQVGGWNELSTTEDLDLTIRLLLEGYSVRYCGEAVLWQEAVPRGYPLLRQRVRWAEGFIKCLFDYTLPLMSRPMPLFKRIDGLASLARCVIPMWVLTAYIALALGMVMGTQYHNGLPWWLFASASGVFFGITFLGIYTVQQLSLVHTAWRVVLYWAYNFIWFFAVPMGFVNCLKNLNTIRWDKTEHCGERQPRVSLPAVAPMHLAEVVE
jgi:1,2-diacylglycerol 3-beta-glucosyltransferase